jgi:TRAP-type C4-dicarboxylate transport system permease small subunit
LGGQDLGTCPPHFQGIVVKQFVEQLAGVTGRLSRMALWIAGTSLVAMTALVAWQVFTRYVLHEPSHLTEPFAVVLMSWFIFLGAAVGTHEGFHMSFDVLSHALPARLRWIPEVISDLVVGLFGLGMVYWGAQLVMAGMDSTIPLVGLPDGVTYVPIVAGGLLFALFSLERLCRRAVGLPASVHVADPHNPVPEVTEA